MKQKIFLVLVVGFLITSPALADHANPFHVKSDDVESALGSTIMGFGTTGIATTVSGGGLELSVDVEIRSLGPIIAYLYKLTLTGDGTLAMTGWGIGSVGTTLFGGPLPGHSIGWVGDPSSGVSPFLVNPTLGSLLFFQFSDFTGGELIVYATSEFLPQVGGSPPPPFQVAEMYFETGNISVDGATIGPHIAGGGASFNVPEASSLLLLTFGLLSGGVLRFRISKP